jgi:hypothetical protein
MPTQRTYTTRIDVGDIREPASAVGAHVGAKLQCFATDERTLTDELCDMLCIWLGCEAQGKRAEAPSGLGAINLILTKMTPAEEVKNGADLELIVSSPLGVKRCLIQAKVLDPDSGKLRCDSTAGWQKLRKQLVAARDEVGDLAFLLVYVPGGLLNGHSYSFGTYEQGFMAEAGGSTEAYMGATLIPVDALLQPKSNRWRLQIESHPIRLRGLCRWHCLLAIVVGTDAVSQIHLDEAVGAGSRAKDSRFPHPRNRGGREFSRPVGRVTTRLGTLVAVRHHRRQRHLSPLASCRDMRWSPA